MRDVKGGKGSPVFERQEFHSKSTGRVRPRAGSRSSVLKEYEGILYVFSNVFKTQVLTDEVREVRN